MNDKINNIIQQTQWRIQRIAYTLTKESQHKFINPWNNTVAYL
jgi:hypothetical protein